MNRSQQLIKTCVYGHIPAIGTGPPGTGKTAWGMTLERDDPNLKVIQVTASVREPADIGGYPMRTEAGLVLEPAAWAKHATQLAEEGYRVVMMWDEARCITARMQTALMKVILENLAGDTPMHPSIAHLAFANSVEDSAGGVPLEPPLANRFAHVAWRVDAEQWCAEMSAGKYAPVRQMDEDVLPRLTAARAEIASFIYKRRDLLHSMPQSDELRDGPWPSPRTWDYAAHLWAQVGPEAAMDYKEELLAACVGVGPAGEYISWRESTDLLDPEEILEGKFEQMINGKTIHMVDKDRPDRTYAILASVTAALTQNWSDKRFVAAMRAMAKAAEEGAGDVAAALVPLILESNQTGKSIDVAKYIVPFGDLLRRARGGN